MSLTSAQFLTLPWPKLAEHARSALSEGQEAAIRSLDLAFHHLFFHEITRGTPVSRGEYASEMAAVIESPEARKIPRPEAIPGILSRWDHLEFLAGSLSQDIDARAEARRIVESRDHGPRLLEVVAAAGGKGIRSGELAGELGISEQNLAALLRHFESHDIIERHREGRSVFVCLGGAGRLLAAAVVVEIKPREFPNDARCTAPLESLRGYLAA